MARVGVKGNGKNNYLMPGTFGPYVDPDMGKEEETKDLDMGKEEEVTQAIKESGW